MVEVFKTNVSKVREAKMLVGKLEKHFPAFKINFDLDDCDKILRVEGKNISAVKIIAIVSSLNYHCKVLD
jgi:hypothetical protein